MADSLLFLAVLIGTAWLCIWLLLDNRQPDQPWSPFDARHLGPAEDAPKPPGRRPVPANAPPLRPWRRRGRRIPASRPAPEPPPWRRRSGS